MSSGKKKHPKKRTYTEVELVQVLKKSTDDAVAKILLLCIVAARDEFGLNEEQTVQFIQTMQRYVDYEKQGLIKLSNASDSLKKETGIDLRLSRWK